VATGVGHLGDCAPHCTFRASRAARYPAQICAG